MNTRVSTFQFQPDKTDEVMDILRTSVIPALKQQHGYHGLLVLTDRQTGKTITITVWETEADLQAGESSGFYQQQVVKVVPFVTAPPSRENYEAPIVQF
jgi:heme-degrading monooxygenase HmoA